MVVPLPCASSVPPLALKTLRVNPPPLLILPLLIMSCQKEDDIFTPLPQNTEINNIADDTKKTENEIQESEEETTLPLEKNEDLEEIELFVPEDEPMKLKKPSDVYLDIYKQAREKAKKAKNEAIKAYLEAKRIKELYMLDIVDSTDSEDSEEDEEELFSEN